jgi:hypothetical protein
VSFIIRNFEERDLHQLVELKRIFENELGWDPAKEYLEEFRKVVLGMYQRNPNS